jgi:hypothetical protein
MKLTVSGEHKDFFQKNHAIEFEGLFNADQAKRLVGAVDMALAARLDIRPGELHQMPPEKLFAAGHDLWRVNDSLRTIVMKRQFAQIAAQLTGQRTLRLGYDQLFPSLKNLVYQTKEGAYSDLLSRPATLSEISSLQGIVCGLMLCLGREEEKDDEVSGTTAVQIFTPHQGHGVFFQPQALMDFPNLNKVFGRRYLLIVYTHSTSVYVQRPADPHSTVLKQMGYSYGDKLLDKWHPIIYRE